MIWRKELLQILGKNVNQQGYYGKGQEVTEEIKNRITIDPAIQLVGINLKEMK